MAEQEILGVALGRGRWYNANEQKMIKLPIGEDGRIVRDENGTGQEIRKGDTLESRKNLIKLATYIGTKRNPMLITNILCSSIPKIRVQEINQPHTKS